MDMPPDAIPSTAAPTQSTSVPPEDDVFCTFQEDNCGFEIEGNGDFKFARTSGSDIESPPWEDHHGNPSGKFLYAQSNGSESDILFTSVKTSEFVGDKHIIECFHFWFNLNGFLVNIIIVILVFNIKLLRMAPKMNPLE